MLHALVVAFGELFEQAFVARFLAVEHFANALHPLHLLLIEVFEFSLLLLIQRLCALGLTLSSNELLTFGVHCLLLLLELLSQVLSALRDVCSQRFAPPHFLILMLFLVGCRLLNALLNGGHSGLSGVLLFLRVLLFLLEHVANCFFVLGEEL